MNRAWITGLAVAGIAGSAGAAFAGVSNGTLADAKAPETQPAPSTPQQESRHDRTISYQVGAAGTVTLTVSNGSLAVASSAAGAGWTVVGATTPGADSTHVEVQFTDSVQLVTFIADLVGDDVVVSLTNVPAPGAATTTAPAVAIDVTVIRNAPHATVPGSTVPGTYAPGTSAPGTSAPGTSAPVLAPAPATPAPTTVQPAPTTVPPASSATTMPSGEGDDDDDDEHEHEHEDEHEEEEEAEDD